MPVIAYGQKIINSSDLISLIDKKGLRFNVIFNSDQKLITLFLMVKIYLFSVENTVIIVSNAINPSKTAPVAKFDKIVNPHFRNGTYQKGMQAKKMADNDSSLYFLFNKINLFIY